MVLTCHYRSLRDTISVAMVVRSSCHPLVAQQFHSKLHVFILLLPAEGASEVRGVGASLFPCCKPNVPHLSSYRLDARAHTRTRLCYDLQCIIFLHKLHV